MAVRKICWYSTCTITDYMVIIVHVLFEWTSDYMVGWAAVASRQRSS